MSERMDHPWLEHAAPYALGALDASDRASFEAHLKTCDICAAEVRAMSDVAGLLATGVAPASPPAGLRDRILADARGVRPIGTARAKEPSVVVAPAPRRASMLPWAAAIAASLVAISLGRQSQGEKAGRLAAEHALASARFTMDSAASALAGRDSLIASLVAPDVQAVSVTGSGPSPSAKYFLDRRANRIVIAASSLPPAATGRTYQLWGIEKGKAPVSLGTFNTDAGGRALATLAVPPGLNVAVTAVTDEPAGGSPRPTTPPFLAATW